MYQNKLINRITYNGLLNKYTVHNKNNKNNDKMIITHTRIPSFAEGVIAGKYNIPQEDMSTFLDYYYEHRFEKGNETYLTEAHAPEYGPVLVDIDLRFDIGDGSITRKYTYDDIIDIVSRLTYYLSKYLELTDTQRQAFIFEKSKPIKGNIKGDDIIKDGIHIIYPYISVPYNVQYVVRSDIIKDKIIKEIFEGMNTINSVDDIIDKCVIEKNNWLLYGSCKPGKEHYQLTKIYVCYAEVDNENEYDYQDPSIKKYTDNIRNLLSILSIYKTECNAQFKKGIDINSIYNKLSDKDKSPSKNKRWKRDKDNYNINAKNICNENKDLIDPLLECLSERRANDHNSWIRVGWCLRNLDYRFLPKWIKFSKKSKKSKIQSIEHGRSGARCEEVWNKTKYDSTGLNLPSLRRWAREDNPGKYEKVITNDCSKILKTCATDVHIKQRSTFQIAIYVHKRYKHEYVCVDVKKDMWYRYDGHKWNTCTGGSLIRNLLAKEVSRQFYNFQIEYARKALESDSEMRTTYRKLSDNFKIIADRLSIQSFKSTLYKDMSDLFYNETFVDNLDKSLNLFHFNNGVYDLDTFTFRPGRSEDNISFSSQIDYIGDELNTEQRDILEDLEHLLEQTFTNYNVKEYILTFIASCLSGKISYELFHIFTGRGSNGKSIFMDLVKTTFGNYWDKVDKTLLTNKRRDANAASPALAKLQGIRIVTLDETEPEDEIKAAFMKELTGGDSITARHLHGNPITFNPQFRVIMIGNDLPKVPNNDDGTWRRIRVVEFNSKFTDNPNPDNEEIGHPQFKKDKTVKDKMNSKEYAEVFLWLLLTYYRKFTKEGLIEPEEVKLTTKEYKLNSNVYENFVNVRITINNRGKGLSSTEAYREFKRSFNVDAGDAKCPPKKDFIKAISRCYVDGRKLGKISGGKWKGFALKPEDDDSDDSNEFNEYGNHSNHFGPNDLDSNSDEEVDI